MKFLCCFIIVLLMLTTPLSSFGLSNSCEDLFNNSPKIALIDRASKDIIKGLGGGLIVCLLDNMLHKDKDKAKERCVFYTIAGMGVAVVYAINEYNLLLSKSPYELPKTYRPPLLQINKIETVDHTSLRPKTIFQEKEYIMLVIRHTLLDLDPKEAVNVRYTFHLYRNSDYLGTFEEIVPIIQGETAISWLFPVCPGTIKGKYKLKLEVIALGQKTSGEVEWIIR